MFFSQSAAPDPSGFVLWTKGFPLGGLNNKASFENHTLSVSHRDKDGLAELHEKNVDVIGVQTGTAKLCVGGEVIEPAVTEPGAIRGRSIKGGSIRTVSQGDVIHIAGGTPHQFPDSAGTTNYLHPGQDSRALIPYLCTAICAFLLVLEAFARGFVKLSTLGKVIFFLLDDGLTRILACHS
jgi:hypothetical protein